MTRRFHQVPTHIGTPEPVLSLGSLSLSAKQFLILLLGGALSYHLWQLLTWLSDPTVLVLRLALSALPVLLAIAFAFVRLADRPLERWGLIVFQFCGSPRLLLWRSLRHDPERLVPVLDEASHAHH
jgi:hypothetical protein